MSCHHRHRKNPVDKSAAADRDARRRELAEKLAAATGLSADDVRIDLASWSALALDIAKQEMLKGRLGDVSLWQRLVDQVNGLVPKADILTVKFVDGSDVCVQCRKPLTPENRAPIPPPPTVDSPAASVTAVKVTDATPDDNKALPSNVTPIRPPKPEPSSPNPFAGLSAAETCAKLNTMNSGSYWENFDK